MDKKTVCRKKMKQGLSHISIGKVELGKVPRIVAVIWGQQLVDSAVRAREDGADVLEVRVDLFKKVNPVSLKKDLKAIKQKVDLPVIVTARRKDEGGGRRYPDGERLRLLKSLIPLIDAVDIELRSRGIIREVIRQAKLEKKKVLVSCHDLVRTPSNEELKNIAYRAKELGGDIVKIAARAKNKDDVVRLLDFTYHCPYKPLVSISLGRRGSLLSRVLAPLFGSCLTYAYVDTPVAPGQLSVSQLRREQKRFF